MTDAGAGRSGRSAISPVGNDIVDLLDGRCIGKSGDRRFLQRVLAPTERATVHGSDDPDVVLWTLWAAKEAAFKVISKILSGPPVFVHADFVVELSAAGGVVRYRDQKVAFVIRGGRTSGALHAVAWSPGRKPFIEGGTAILPAHPPGRHRLSDRELRGVHSSASALVRLKARAHLARSAGVPEEELEIVCESGPAGRTPPRVLQRGTPAPWDVSLSHHGRLVGWTVALPPSPQEPVPDPWVPDPNPGPDPPEG